MKTYTVAILGVTGAVGQEMLRLLQERDFPVKELVALASARSAGGTVTFRGQSVPIREVSEAAFQGVDIVLGAAENDVAMAWAPAIRAAGAIFIDNSSAFRMKEDVPLVVPECNAEDVAAHQGLIANPNCTTAISLTAVQSLRKLGQIKSMVASSYQAVSGAGAAGLAELQAQMLAFTRGENLENKAFAYPILCNLIPQIGGEQELGYTSEEMKLHYEGRKILHLPDLQVSCTCVRVPVMRSHSVSLHIRFDRPVSVEDAREVLAQAPGCKLMDDLKHGCYPMPLDATGQDLVLVGRVRQDLTDPNALNLWCCGDQLRKGAATNAIQIAELLIR
jgi:aspartate-semialdehyde dehydrogenase